MINSASMRMRFCFAVLAIVRLLSIASHAAEKPTCAVLTFYAGAGISADEAAFVTDRFTAFLSQAEEYTVIARSKMREILRTAEFNRSENCSATDCAIEAGQILQVRYMIFGSVGHIGNLYSLNSSLIDVESGSILRTAVTDHEGSITGFAKMTPSANIRALLGQGPLHSATSDDVTRRTEYVRPVLGEVVVSVFPRAARLYLDGKPLASTRFRSPADRPVTIEALHPGHETQTKTVIARARSVTYVDLYLPRLRVHVAGVKTKTLAADSQSLGRSNVTSTHSLQSPEDKERIVVSVRPRNAELTVDGETQTVREFLAPAGRALTINARLAGHDEDVRKLTPKGGGRTYVDMYLPRSKTPLPPDAKTRSPALDGLASLLPGWSGSLKHDADIEGRRLQKIEIVSFATLAAASGTFWYCDSQETPSDLENAAIFASGSVGFMAAVTFLAATIADVAYSTGKSVEHNKRLGQKRKTATTKHIVLAPVITSEGWKGGAMGCQVTF